MTRKVRRRKNPIQYAIYIKRGKTGPKMHYARATPTRRGLFTNNGHPALYNSKSAAFIKGQQLARKYARILHGYRMTVEPARGFLPRRA